jgi:DNA-binding NarL/FixJ family response regulator
MKKTPKTTSLRIIIVDDHQMFIDGIKFLLESEKHIKVVGEALDGIQALNLLKNIQADIVITDIEMPKLNGIELSREIKKNYPDVKVIVLTMYNDKQIINEIVMTEAEGYILKNTGKQELIEAIDRVADNATYYSKEVVQILMENYHDNEKNDILHELSAREKQIISLICLELSTVEIAEKLFLSPLTVETHRKNILRKTRVKTIVGLIKFAIRNKLDIEDK